MTMDEIVNQFMEPESTKVAIVADDPVFIAFCQELEDRDIKVWNGETDIYNYALGALPRGYKYIRYDKPSVTATRAYGYTLLSLDNIAVNGDEQEIEEQASLLLWS